ncbi:MAG: alpha/beta fold hydrolase [Candidatus Dormibacteraeota bacterium]|nr:alpha/beta fold hydrolase [Candidatus Dormibacteraeota bacterium]
MTGGPAMHDSGEGPAVLFLHAFPLDASQWDHQVAALSDARRCLRPAIWGCGDSPPPPEDAAGLDDYARAIVSALDERGVDRFSVVGLSMGGYVAFEIWRLAAARIGAIAFCNTRAGADSDASRSDRLAMAERVLSEGSPESIVEASVERLLGPRARREAHITDPVRGRIRRCTPAGIAFAQRAMAARRDSTPTLAAIGVPTLVVAGRDDAVIPAADVDSLAAGLPAAARVDLDCGHLSNLELPHEFNRTLAEFLDSAPAA